MNRVTRVAGGRWWTCEGLCLARRTTRCVLWWCVPHCDAHVLHLHCFGCSPARLSQLLFVKGHVGMCLCVWHFLFRGRCQGHLLATRCTGHDAPGDQSVGVP